MNEFEEKNIESEVEETVKEMKAKIDEITAASEGVEDEEASLKISEIKDKAIGTLNKAIDGLASVGKDIKNSEQVNKTVEYVKAKAKELSDSALKKIEEIKNDEALKNRITETANAVKEKGEELIESVKENETVMNVVNTVADAVKDGIENVKEGIENVVSKPEVSEKLNKAKETTLDVAEKAVKALKDWLRPENKDSEE